MSSPQDQDISTEANNQEEIRGGFVYLWRKMLEWEWYTDSKTVHLFIHLLLSANHKSGYWHGEKIERGQVVTGLNALCRATGISPQSIRTCINRLKSTGNITIKSTNRFSIITICNYDRFQNKKSTTNKQVNTQTNNLVTTNQQATNKQLTTNNKSNNNNKSNKSNNNNITNKETPTLIQFGKVLRMSQEQMDETIKLFGRALVDQEIPEADFWLENADTPNARKYRRPEHNHYLFFRSTWLRDKKIKSHASALKDLPNGLKSQAINQMTLQQIIQEEDFNYET